MTFHTVDTTSVPATDLQSQPSACPACETTHERVALQEP
jgi:hypothetical protein